MSFGTPLALFALLLVPAALVAYLVMQSRRAQYAVRFTNVDLLANLVDKEPGWRRHLPSALYLVALAALLLALAKPERNIDVPREEATIILVTDISGSMNARDIEPTRLVAAQAAGNLLLDQLPEKFQVGLISFSSAVTVVAPPTTDRELIRSGLARLKAVGGTAMGDALMAAIEQIDILQNQEQALDTPGGAAKPTPVPTNRKDANGRVPAVIILLSDGQQTLGRAQPLDAADEAAARGIPIFTIALGTQDGVVDVTDNQGRTRTIRVPPDEQTLQKIADATGAEFFSAPSEKDLETVYKDLGSFIGHDTEKREVTVWVAAIAALFLVAGGTCSLLWFNRLP